MRLMTLIFILFVVTFQPLFADMKTDPSGYWNTVDDKSGKVLSVMKIWQTKEETFSGKIVKIMPVEVDGRMQNEKDTCTKCSGKLKDQPILGMVIMHGMSRPKLGDTFFSGGRILDPQTGNVYKSNMTLEKKGMALHLRGYIGIPLFGRTEVWQRTVKPKLKKQKK